MATLEELVALEDHAKKALETTNLAYNNTWVRAAYLYATARLKRIGFEFLSNHPLLKSLTPAKKQKVLAPSATVESRRDNYLGFILTSVAAVELKKITWLPQTSFTIGTKHVTFETSISPEDAKQIKRIRRYLEKVNRELGSVECKIGNYQNIADPANVKTFVRLTISPKAGAGLTGVYRQRNAERITERYGEQFAQDNINAGALGPILVETGNPNSIYPTPQDMVDVEKAVKVVKTLTRLLS